MSEKENPLHSLKKKQFTYLAVLITIVCFAIGSLWYAYYSHQMMGEYEDYRHYCLDALYEECEEYKERHGDLTDSEISDLYGSYSDYRILGIVLFLLGIFSSTWFGAKAIELSGHVKAQELLIRGGLDNLKSALEICSKHGLNAKSIEAEIAKEEEKILDYDGAIEKYTKVGLHKDAARVRKLQADMGSVKVAQKVVQGDQITKTEIKDSVLNRSNVGGGSSKMQELKELTEMKEKGLIDDDEFKQMKKEILGK
jgi:hypothetical protein